MDRGGGVHFGLEALLSGAQIRSAEGAGPERRDLSAKVSGLPFPAYLSLIGERARLNVLDPIPGRTKSGTPTAWLREAPLVEAEVPRSHRLPHDPSAAAEAILSGLAASCRDEPLSFRRGGEALFKRLAARILRGRGPAAPTLTGHAAGVSAAGPFSPARLAGLSSGPDQEAAAGALKGLAAWSGPRGWISGTTPTGPGTWRSAVVAEPLSIRIPPPHEILPDGRSFHEILDEEAAAAEIADFLFEREAEEGFWELGSRRRREFLALVSAGASAP